MPMCGFNQQMLEGLNMFHIGLVEHGLIQRAKNKNKQVFEILNQEIREMDEFLNEIPGIKNKEKREVIENLTRYAKAFYILVQKVGYKKAEKIILDLNKTYKSMDEEYYTNLENKPNRMKKLVEFLNSSQTF
jgi:enoyl reductase-like protein